MSDRGVDPIVVVVPMDLDGQRADKVLAATLGLSRGAARDAIDAGNVRHQGESVQPAGKLAAGTRLEVLLAPEPDGIEPLDSPLVVRYESEATLVIDKPAGLVVHPGAGHRNDTLASILIHHRPELATLGEEHRWGLVHRLDRETSGLLLVGRTVDAHAALQAQLKQREVARTYLAVACAEIEPITGTIEAPIGRDPEQPTKMGLRQDGRFARTHYRRLASWDGLSLLEVQLDTGRTHQIRVHLSSIGAPLAGDKTYGARRSTAANPGRVWLHAWRLEFADPANGQHVAVSAPLPEELRRSLAQLGEPKDGAEGLAGLSGGGPI